MRVTTNAKIISVGDKEFTGKQGDKIAFKQAVLVIDGEVFTVTVDKDADVTPQEEEGTATLDISEYNGKIRVRLVDFS